MDSKNRFSQMVREEMDHANSLAALTRPQEPSISMSEAEFDALDDGVVTEVLMESKGLIPLGKMSFKELFDQFSKPFAHALSIAKLNSIHGGIFGFLNQLDICPKNMKRVSYGFCDEPFYVLKDSSREAMTYNLITSAAMQCQGNTFTMPAVLPATIDLTVTPADVAKGAQEVVKPITIFTLNFTPDEIKYMSFSFIRSIQLKYNRNSTDPFKNASYVFTVDKELLGSQPYAVDGE